MPPLLNTEYVLLPNVLAGTGCLAKFGCENDCLIGRGPKLRRFRHFLLHHLGLDGCSSLPPRGYISFSLPVSMTEQAALMMKDSAV